MVRVVVEVFVVEVEVGVVVVVVVVVVQMASMAGVPRDLTQVQKPSLGIVIVHGSSSCLNLHQHLLPWVLELLLEDHSRQPMPVADWLVQVLLVNQVAWMQMSSNLKTRSWTLSQVPSHRPLSRIVHLGHELHDRRLQLLPVLDQSVPGRDPHIDSEDPASKHQMQDLLLLPRHLLLTA